MIHILKEIHSKVKELDVSYQNDVECFRDKFPFEYDTGVEVTEDDFDHDMDSHLDQIKNLEVYLFGLIQREEYRQQVIKDVKASVDKKMKGIKS